MNQITVSIFRCSNRKYFHMPYRNSDIEYEATKSTGKTSKRDAEREEQMGSRGERGP